MGNLLSNAQIIRLHRELVAPLAVYQILKGHDELDETALYTLDVMLAEFQPDTALLCMALCAAHIADLHQDSLPLAGSLGFEAGRIVHDLGPLWLDNADQRLGMDQESRVLDVLDRMAEDFEALADLLDGVRAHLIETTDSAMLCDILSQNAQGFIAYLDHRAQEEQVMEHHYLLQNLEVHGNVITFPRQHRSPL